MSRGQRYRVGVCADCGDRRPLVVLGLCHACYQKHDQAARAAGTDALIARISRLRIERATVVGEIAALEGRVRAALDDEATP